MRHARLVTLWVALCLSPAALFAQTVPSQFRFIEERHSIGVYGGYLAADAGSLDVGPESAPIFGARYNLRLAGPLSGEAALGISPSERTIYTAVESGEAILRTPITDTNLTMLLGEAGLRFHFTGQRTWRGIAPYGVATIGVVADLTRSSPIEEQIDVAQEFDFGPSFAAAIGLGTDLFMSDRLSLRLEAKDYLWRLTYPEGLTDSRTEETEWRHNFALTLGGAIHF